MAAVFRAMAGYYFLVFMMRIAGRRPGKQMTPMEFILVFFSGGLTLTAMVADDRSLMNAFSQIATIALAHYILVVLRLRFPVVGRIVDGTPLVLLEKNKWRTAMMKAMQIQDDDVMAIARDQGLERLEQVEYAVLERNGQISIVPVEEK
ncbi:MAG TPA: YetF domain-containing protein [Bryobacteraceae bacterium]|jgi:uncharacterized membrane protein YcaP (DUF421 family)|nr:YetF domain-containing protein [Bryobacteraceae bacterium]